MSGWRILVRDVAAMPQPCALEGRDSDARLAVALGLLESCGRRTDGPTPRPILYRVTEAGRLFAEGRLALESRRTGRPGRPSLRPVATWPRALPTVTPSQWGGL